MEVSKRVFHKQKDLSIQSTRPYKSCPISRSEILKIRDRRLSGDRWREICVDWELQEYDFIKKVKYYAKAYGLWESFPRKAHTLRG